MTIQQKTPPRLSAEDIARVRQPLEQAYTLPPAAYTDPDIYEREVALIMRKSWLPLARVDQVAKPGDYISLDLFGQPVMVVHGKDGDIRTMSRVCLHRAAPLTEDGAGHRSLFTCPYHAWSYDTAGELVRTPLMEGADGFDDMSATDKACRLPQIRTEIWNGFIMANLDEDAEPFAPQVAGFTRYFEKFNLDDLVVVKTLDFPSNWNWKVLVENFMEAYHHIATHATTFGPIFPAGDSNVPDNDGATGSGLEGGPWSILHMPTADDHETEADTAADGSDSSLGGDLYANVIFPHFLLGVQGTGTAWYQVLPESHDRLMLKIHFCLPRHLAEEDKDGAHAEATAEMLTIIHNEDIEANDMVWRGLNAPLTKQGRLSPLEKGIWQMNQWWLDKMTEAGA